MSEKIPVLLVIFMLLVIIIYTMFLYWAQDQNIAICKHDIAILYVDHLVGRSIDDFIFKQGVHPVFFILVTLFNILLDFINLFLLNFLTSHRLEII